MTTVPLTPNALVLHLASDQINDDDHQNQSKETAQRLNCCGYLCRDYVSTEDSSAAQ